MSNFVKKFNWKLARITLLKTFVTSFFTPIAGVQVIIDPELILSIYIGLITSGIMCGIVFGQVLDRYMQFLKEENPI
jgi:hypothetical protein